MRSLRLIWLKRLQRRNANGNFHVPRGVGILMILVGVSGLVHVHVGFQSSATAAPVSALADTHTSVSLKTKVHELAADFMVEHKPVGLAIGIVDAETSFALGLGETYAGNATPPDEHTLFEIGSITKTFTATVLADLITRRELSLDQPLETLLPAAEGVPSFDGQPITLRHLATHTSGLPRLPPGLLWKLLVPGFARNPYRWYSPVDLYDLLKNHKLETKPGEKWEYSNLGAGLLGFALAQHTSCTCDALYRAYICDRLGMHDTAIALSAEQRQRLAKGYSDSLSTGSTGLFQEADNWDFQDTLAGAGALKSTVHDMLIYLQANINTTTSPVGAACEYAQQVHFSDGNTTMGLGWVHLTVKDVGPVLFHDGGTGGYRSVIMFTRAGCGVVILCNSAGASVTKLGMDALHLLSKNRGN